MSQEYKNTKDNLVKTAKSSRVTMNKGIFSSNCGFRRQKKLEQFLRVLQWPQIHLSILNYIEKNDVKIKGNNQIFM